MGRSTFPGKPTKHVNRTRVNVLPGPTSTTVGESSVNMTVDLEEDSKKVDVVPEEDQNKTINTCNTQINRINRRRKNLSNKRSPPKRNILLSSTTSTLTTKINIVTHVSRRTRSKVKSRRSVRSFSTIRKVNGRHPGTSLRDSNNLVGKFVLPSRSVHSSRVIKPNKRFINVEFPDNRTFKKKVLHKKQNIKCNEVKTKCKTNVSDESEEPVAQEQSAENVDSDNCQVSCTKGKPLLREARLQIGSKNTLSPDGPFSLTTNVGTPPGFVTCGVCGAVRYPRMLKQVKKLNIYSCESCRKFISKMIKRQKCKNMNTMLVCQDGQGTCIVSSIVRNQNSNISHRTRCSACWLKMCLRSFQLPLSLRNCLVQLLPQHMQDNDSLFGGSSFPLTPWPANVDNKILNVDKQNEVKVENTNSSVDNKNISIRQRPVRLKPIIRDDKTTVNVNSRGIKRQKIDLKGPRVKHVCRSASIVLGQPLATFPSNQTQSKDSTDILEVLDSTPKDDKSINVQEDNKKVRSSNEIDNVKNTEPTDMPATLEVKEEVKPTTVLRSSCQKLEIVSTMQPRRDKFKNSMSNSAIESKPIPTHKKPVNNLTGICIDFWESYDPDEICKNGFCIIGSEPLPTHAICFLCGSGGREPLLHCSLCCEPYHPFCLEQVPSDITNNNQRFNWLCPRCTVCNSCGQMDRQKINCQKCHKDYHPECFSDKWRTNDKPLVCSNCLRCSCGSVNITKFVGNIPLCVNCFKGRKNGNFCPLCQKCYDENDYESKMMECNKCKKWIHARCEGLSDEHYQILSILPESIEYQCHTCSNNATVGWRKAIQAELRSCFSNVIRLLSKNPIARNLIKWSPVKNISTAKTLGSAKKLQFLEEDGDIVSECKNSHIDVPKKTIVKDINLKSKEGECEDFHPKSPMSPIMVKIKNKLNSTEHMTIREFNQSMEQAISNSPNEELLSIYHSIMKRVFPWFDPNTIEDPLDNSVYDSKTESEEFIKEVLVDFDFKYATTNSKIDDTRVCTLCKGIGDGLSHQEARLLYCGHNEWIHANCALWSSEVYEEIDGSLQNVPSAITRGRSMRCAKCKHRGASVGCCLKGCYETYHFRCAQQASCYFLHDKNVYCHSHELENKSNILTSPTEFHINRSVYIELDKKRKKYLEPEKVHFMVGSLSVTNLGKIVPILSDTPESLLPAGFMCSRLFWSTNEPWKLVPYIITTSVLNTSSINTTIDRNFTIDHNLPRSIFDKKIKELGMWLKEQDRDNNKLYLEEEDEDEPQNVDILLPELINDDIFEELPHDLLDGISVQDMLKSSEELLNIDCNAEISCNDNIMNNENLKKSDEDDFDYENKNNCELKRSKSEVFQQISDFSKARSHQRSCSVTVSCKMDNSLSPVIKKRKINQINRDPNIFFQLLQVDGGADSSGSECGSPTHEIEDTWDESIEEPVTCGKCQCTYRTAASYKRHMETCDALLTSESDSEEQIGSSPNNSSITEQNSLENTSIIVKVNEQEPQLIASYESYSSYHATQNEVHSTILNTQTFVTAESTSEVVAVQDNPTMYYPAYPQQIVEQKPVASIISPQQNIAMNQINQVSLNPSGTITISQNTSSVEDCATVTATGATLPMNQNHTTSFCVNQTPICVNQANSISNLISVDNSQSVTLNPALNQQIAINPTGSITINQPVELQPQQMTIQQVPFSHEITPILNITPQNQITIDAKMIATPNICNSVVTQTVPQNQWMKPIVKPTLIAQKTIRPRARPTRNLAAKSSTTIAKHLNGTTVVLPQTNNTNTSVIFQHLPSTNMVPTFVDQFQQQSGQNLQYVATVTPQINQPQIVQIQPDNNFLSIVPGVQPTMIIQQPRVVADQLIVDSNGSMIWAAQPVQPIYYGFETIVQNTVMQSQQFLPTTVPGVLTTNSSYSATTQVFQTSKLEPVLDVTQGSFVLVNNCPGQIINSQSIQSVQVPHTGNQNLSTASVVQSKPNIWKIVEPPTVSEPPVLSTTHIQIKPIVSKSHPTNSITLPVAPFVSEQGIPTNVVTPTPKPPSTNQQQVRPMSRVLPMQTNSMREVKKPIIADKQIDLEKKVLKDDMNKLLLKIDKPRKVHIIQDVQMKSPKEGFKLEMKSYKNSLEPIKSDPAIDCSKRIEEIFHSSKIIDVFDSIKSVHAKPILEPHKPSCEPLPSIFVPIKADEDKNSSSILKQDVKSPKQSEKKQDCESVEINTSDEKMIKNESQNLKLVLQKDDTIDIINVSSLNETKFEMPPANIEIDGQLKSITQEKVVVQKDITINKIENGLKLPSLSNEENLKEHLKEEDKSTVPNNHKILSFEPKQIKDKLNTSNQSAILYTVETQDGFRYSSTSLSELWGKVFEAVQNARINHNMTPLPTNSLDIINNLQLLGLKTNGLKYLIEQLPGANKCTKYKPIFHIPSVQEDSGPDSVDHTGGAVRCVMFGNKGDEHVDMFGWLASKHRNLENSIIETELLPRRGSMTNLPMAMRFRQLKTTSKISVGVYRSGIHGRGLFALRNFESGEMVIEYAGEVIRSILTDKREKYYNSKGIGCYMFRIDDNLVIDATMKGNAARFINHSCDPNCYSKVVEIHGHKHIIIFALRRIYCQEELTYDYKFPFEEDKIPCTCGARKCRKFLN